MRVLFITNSIVGMYEFRKEIVEAYSKYADTFLCGPDSFHPEFWDKIGCTVIDFKFDRHGTNPIKESLIVFKYIKIIRNIKPDMVFTYTIKPNVYAGIACSLLKVPYIANVTGLGDAIENPGLLHYVSCKLYMIGIKKAKCVFFQNKANYDFFRARRMLHSKGVVIPGSGVNLADHYFERYPDGQENIRFLYVGRIKKEKGMDELLSAIHHVRTIRQDCILNVVGDYEDDYEALITKYESYGDIKYYGIQEDVHKYYKDCHCVVLPSYHEGMSNVLLEASATGRPVIATSIPGCSEIFDEGITGLGCKVKDCESLAKALLRFLSMSSEERERMGACARKKIEKEFDRKLVAEAYLKEFNGSSL